jgi:hypothetical protein
LASCIIINILNEYKVEKALVLSTNNYPDALVESCFAFQWVEMLLQPLKEDMCSAVLKELAAF